VGEEKLELLFSPRRRILSHHPSHLHAIGEGLEFAYEFVIDLSVVLHDLIVVRLGVEVLAVDDLLDDGSQCRLDVSIGEFGIRGGVGDGLLTEVVKGDDRGQHSDGLGERTGVIVFRESVLGQEVLADELGDLHDNLLILR